MTKVNALTLRQSLGKVLRDLDRSGEPVLVEKGREARAVLISLRDFNERFVDKVAAQERQQLVADIAAQREKAGPSADRARTVDLLRALRGPLGKK